MILQAAGRIEIDNNKKNKTNVIIITKNKRRTMNLKIIFLITLLIIAPSMGCITNPDTDRDGYSDDVDEFPANPKYHATCSECDGSGIITRAREKDVEHTSEGHCKNRGIFSPDYHSTVTVTNTDSTGGIFEVYE